MTCDELRAKLLDLVYEELPDDEQRPCEEHLAGCASCRGEFDALKQTTAALDSLPVPKGKTRVTELLRHAAVDSQRGARRWRRLAVAATAAGLLIGAFAALGMRIEATPQHVTFYFGERPRAAAPDTPVQPATFADPWPAIGQQADELARLDDLFRLLATEYQTDRQRQQLQLVGLRQDTTAISRELALRWALLRRDVDDMYAFQYPTESPLEGDQP